MANNAKQALIEWALLEASHDVILKSQGLTRSFWDWILPWRARAWQRKATKVIANLVTTSTLPGLNDETPPA